MMLAMGFEGGNGRAYIVLSPAFFRAEVAHYFEVFPTFTTEAEVFLVNATVEDACRACGGGVATVCLEYVSSLLYC